MNFPGTSIRILWLSLPCNVILLPFLQFNLENWSIIGSSNQLVHVLSGLSDGLEHCFMAGLHEEMHKSEERMAHVVVLWRRCICIRTMFSLFNKGKHKSIISVIPARWRHSCKHMHSGHLTWWLLMSGARTTTLIARTTNLFTLHTCILSNNTH